MKSRNFIAIVATCALLPATVLAQTTTTTETTIEANPDGTVTETTRTITIEPEVRTRVVEYFEPYKTERFGLPPEVATKIEVKKIPEEWRTVGINRGTVIAAENRPFLVAAPPKLVEILPADPDKQYRHYIAGGNVIVVDAEYQVVDSIRIPTITF